MVNNMKVDIDLIEVDNLILHQLEVFPVQLSG